MDDVDQVVALAVAFVLSLPLLIFTMVRLEDTIGDPPTHLGRRVLALLLHFRPRRH